MDVRDPFCLLTEIDSFDRAAVRRSSRRKLAPLEYWRNERVIYKKRPSGIGIEGVVRIAKDSPQWAQRNKRGGSAKATVKRARSNSRVKSEVPEEEGVDDMTDEMGIVWNWENDTEVKRRQLPLFESLRLHYADDESLVQGSRSRPRWSIRDRRSTPSSRSRRSTPSSTTWPLVSFKSRPASRSHRSRLVTILTFAVTVRVRPSTLTNALTRCSTVSKGRSW